jgi:hypothetical protein
VPQLRHNYASGSVCAAASDGGDQGTCVAIVEVCGAVLEYTNHYHAERNHQGLDNELIVPAKAANGVGKVNRRERLGGLLRFYYREAA